MRFRRGSHWRCIVLFGVMEDTQGLELQSDCFDFGKKAVVHPSFGFAIHTRFALFSKLSGQAHAKKKHWIRVPLLAIVISLAHHGHHLIPCRVEPLPGCPVHALLSGGDSRRPSVSRAILSMPFPLRLVNVDGNVDGERGTDDASCSTVQIELSLPLVARSDIASSSLPRGHSPNSFRSMIVMSFMISSNTPSVSFRQSSWAVTLCIRLLPVAMSFQCLTTSLSVARFFLPASRRRTLAFSWVRSVSFFQKRRGIWCRLSGCLVGWLFVSLAGWLAVCLVGRLIACLIFSLVLSLSAADVGGMDESPLLNR